MADEGSHNTRPVWARGRQAPMAKLAVRLRLKISCPEDVRVRLPLGAPIISSQLFNQYIFDVKGRGRDEVTGAMPYMP